jgi:NADH-quinone oxidoreductase subunit J
MAKYLPLALLIGVVLMMQLAIAFGVWEFAPDAEGMRAQVIPPADQVENTRALGLILLVAMIGAIVLTLRHRTDVKRQDVLAQMYRDPAKAMELKDVKPGQGL